MEEIKNMMKESIECKQEFLDQAGNIKLAADKIRAQRSGPIFFEILTYRLKEHVGPTEDFQAGYRNLKESEKWLVFSYLLFYSLF